MTILDGRLMMLMLPHSESRGRHTVSSLPTSLPMNLMDHLLEACIFNQIQQLVIAALLDLQQV